MDGKLINYYEHNWAAMLYGGTNIIDSDNRQLLYGIQRLAFLARELPGGPKTLTTFKNFLWSLNLLVRWAFLNGEVLNPRQYILTKLTLQNFVDFFSGLGNGGTVFALRYPERILGAIFPMALGRAPSIEELENPLCLNREDCVEVAKWLEEQGALVRVKRSSDGNVFVKRGFLAKMIGVDANTLRGGPRWGAFLGQFSLFHVPFEQIFNKIEARGRREYPSQKAMSMADASVAGVSEKTLSKYFEDIRIIASLHRHLPDVCPDPVQFRPAYLRKVIVEVSSVSNHTPWIPLPIAINYTTEALRWVHVYGDDLVSLFLTTYENLYGRGLLVSAPIPNMENPTASDYIAAHRALSKAREQYVSLLSIPDSLIPLDLTGWGPYIHLDGKKGVVKLQKAPSYNDALMVLIGAISIVIAMVKPMRESELRALKTDCLTFVSGDGYWLSQDLRKRNIGDIRPIDARPIPTVAAKAIQLLRRLTDGLKRITKVTDPWLLNSLMTFPSFGRYEAKIAEVISPGQFNALLDAFCDYVALPPDHAGRRWYLRIHEMRKSFLITFFWTFRFASLDAARWMAGHADASQVYAYIQANFPGEELPGLEADYAAQVLRDYEQSGTTQGVNHVAELYQAVCDHFSVRDVSWIDEVLLKEWLELQFEVKEFQIIPYSIKSHDGGVVTEIAFRVTSLTDMEKNHE
ncbi:hypothetical protein [Chitinimonas naiadis]